MLEIVGSKMKTITPSFRVLGVRIDAVKTFEAVARMERLIETSKTCSYVAVTGMHGIAEAQQDPGFREILNQADLVVPDGMPLVWLARWHRHPLRRRVPGSELMEAFCKKRGRVTAISFMEARRKLPRIWPGNSAIAFKSPSQVPTHRLFVR
jgi:UDP-N-acetyl-D-mannosaminuronic acid transferase (WecB/TagA/CpsF family)